MCLIKIRAKAPLVEFDEFISDDIEVVEMSNRFFVTVTES